MKKESTTYSRASETFRWKQLWVLDRLLIISFVRLSPPFPLGNVLKVDEVTLNPNGVFVRVLVEVDLRVHLKRVLIINDDDDCPILVSYEKLFEACFYYDHMRPDGHIFLEYEMDDRCFLIERMFEDEPAISPEDTNVDDDINEPLHDDVMLCFPVALLPEENFMETKEVGQIMVVEPQENEGWTTVVLKWKKKAERRYGFGQVKGGKSYKDVASESLRNAGKDVGKVEKYKWVPRGDLVQGWRKSPSKMIMCRRYFYSFKLIFLEIRFRFSLLDVGSGLSNRVVGNKGEMDVNMVFASMAAEVSRPPLRLMVGMISPRKRIREDFANEAGTSYLNELD
ncbi:hypothetical protein ACFX13_014751 [Malus domestica]